MEFNIKNERELKELAGNFLKNLPPATDPNAPKNKATIVALKGNLGSGKTTFTQACAEILGTSQSPTSPTFVILKRYPFQYASLPTLNNLIHIDAYRIEDPKELIAIGWNEIIKDAKNLIFLEWPENVTSILPDDIIKVQFEFVDENTRKITMPDTLQ